MASAEVSLKIACPMLEIAQTVEEQGGEQLKDCYQCGTCTAVCPWGDLRPFSPRRFIELARMGLEGFESDAWTCVTCKRCWDRCPQDINIPQLFQSVRRILLESSSNPRTMNQPLGSIRTVGNPWGEPIEKREAWVRQAEVPVYGPGVEHLLFSCCTNDYDARNKLDSKAIVEVLRAAGTSFGHLGNDQRCCGDLAYTAGDTGAFEQMREANQATFGRARAASVVLTSPHCLHAFKHRYDDPEGRKRETGNGNGHGDTRYRHVVELFAEALKAGALKPTRPLARKITYHDPCYLGRYNGVYDAPREVLAAIPGLEVKEMAHNREASLCCGGGGGGVWVETGKGERLGDLRIKEALAVGAEAIATACPFCVQMLESSIMSFGLEQQLKVVTVAELLAESLRPGEG